jgi:hypothetical protein
VVRELVVACGQACGLGYTRRGEVDVPQIRRQWMVMAALLFAWSACGVPSAGGACRRDPATNMLECQPGFSGVGGSLLTLALAIVLYAYKGCTINGCELPYTCNAETKRCEPLRCSETRSCPAGYRCIMSSKLCR